MQLDFLALLDASLAPPVQVSADLPYVIRSQSERGFWSNELGWVYDLASATRFGVNDVCPAHVRQLQLDSKPSKNCTGRWFWVARHGGMGGHKGADYDGPFATEQEAVDDAVLVLGAKSPGLVQIDAEFALASEATNFPLDS